MPAKHTLHVVLTEPLVRYVRGKVTDGASPSVSGVVRLAIEALIEREGRSADEACSSSPEAGKPVNV